MLKTAALIVVIAIAGVLLYAAIQPDNFRIERTASIKAPPEKIYPHISELRTWNEWSPWEKKDPNMKRTFSGPASGKGAAYAWEGNKDVGEGRMEIAEATAPSNVKVDLHFLKPFEARNVANFTLRPQGDATTVTWSMEGKQPFLGKVMCLFLNMDDMIGKDFEAGLASLKAVAEKT
jgi:hypothetical protein